MSSNSGGDVSLRDLSCGEGPPMSPWFFVSESFFAWLQCVDLCPRKSLLRGIHNIVFGNDDSLVDSTIATLMHSTEDYFHCSCKDCSQGNPPTEVPFLLAPRMPIDAVGKLLPAHDWPFDHRGGPGLLKWIARRLLEYCNHHRWASPYAEFPAPGTNVEGKGVTVSHSGNAFDPRNRQTICGGPDPSKPWIKLVHCFPRMGCTQSNLSRKWLPYLFRGPLPDRSNTCFPPLTCSLPTLLSEQEWDQCAALQLFGTFENCAVQILVKSCIHQPAQTLDSASMANNTISDICHLSGINGVTVLFLSLLDSDHAVNLLADSKSGELIISDLLLNPGAQMLLEDRPSGHSAHRSVVRGLITRLCRKAFHSKAPNRQILARIAEIMQVWLSRTEIRVRLASSVTPARAALQVLLLLMDFPASFIEDDSDGSDAGKGPGSPCWAHLEGYLGLVGVFCGCAIAAVTSVSFHRDEPGTPQTLHESPAMCPENRSLPLALQQYPECETEVERYRLLLNLTDEYLVLACQSLPDGMTRFSFYGHFTKALITLKPRYLERLALVNWLEGTPCRIFGSSRPPVRSRVQGPLMEGFNRPLDSFPLSRDRRLRRREAQDFSAL